MFRTLADEDINLRLISTSPIKISCLIPRSDVERAVRALHAAFSLGESRRAAAAMSTDVQATADAREPEPRTLRRRVDRARPSRELLLLLSSFAVWINRVALNTGVFTDTSSSLLDDDAIRTAVANRAVDELFANVDVQAEVEEQLPRTTRDCRAQRPRACGRRRTRS